MPRYQIYRLKESHRKQFRDAPPTAPPLTLKRKDYDAAGEIDAASPYAVWQQMRADRGLEIGDALETDTGALVVCRYVGFDEARWWLPPETPAAAGAETPPASNGFPPTGS